MLNIPAGYKLVPIEPTETMVVCGFESRPDPVFSKPEDWEAFAAMTGCQQAAHKARLCYAAMLDAAPTPPSVAPGDTQDELQADACPRCEGSGEITVMSDNSPDAHDVIVCCDHCQGSGAAVDAAKYLAAALSGEKYRHMQLWAEYRNFHRSLCVRFGYGHDEVHFRRDLVSLEEAIAAKVAAPAAGDALPNFDIEAAAKKMAECMDYPWAHMPEQGRTHMRKYAQAVIDAAIAAQQGQEES
ncbi:hypothetical protein [Achromobacter denitrificans]|uniref:hypothetical protein n=1 Tax=Achromobacter denitrificans TaxID=32002 RepID=UPI0014685257|nr:hypothetical protein [Achromobacter denitrificans]CAB3812137.1 hypothetical protein LMG1860_00436 [Achromobacter denitrificans]